MKKSFFIQKNIRKLLFCISALTLLTGCGNKQKKTIEADERLRSAILKKCVLAEMAKESTGSLYQTENGFVRVAGGEKSHTESESSFDIVAFSRVYQLDGKTFTLLSLTADPAEKDSCTVNARIRIQTLDRVRISGLTFHAFTPVDFSGLSGKKQKLWFETALQRLPENPLDRDLAVQRMVRSAGKVVKTQEKLLKEQLILDPSSRKWVLKQNAQGKSNIADPEAETKANLLLAKAGFREFRGTVDGKEVIWHLSPEDFRFAEKMSDAEAGNGVLLGGPEFKESGEKSAGPDAASMKQDLKLEKAVMNFKKEKSAENFIALLDAVIRSEKNKGCREAQELCIKYLDHLCKQNPLSKKKHEEQEKVLDALQKMEGPLFFNREKYISSLSTLSKTFDPQKSEELNQTYEFKMKDLYLGLNAYLFRRDADAGAELKRVFLEYIRNVMQYPDADFAADAEKLLSVFPKKDLPPFPESKAKAYRQESEQAAMRKMKKPDFEGDARHRIEAARRKYVPLAKGQGVQFVWSRSESASTISVSGSFGGLSENGKFAVIGKNVIPVSEIPTDVRVLLTKESAERKLKETIREITIGKKAREIQFKMRLRPRADKYFRAKLLRDGYIFLPNRQIVSPGELLKRLKEKNTEDHRITEKDIKSIFG